VKKLSIIAVTIGLLAWSSISQATILSATYTGDGSGALDSTATWTGDNSQVTITGSQTSLPATTSLALTTDTDADPTITPYNWINNDTDFSWSGYQICFVGSKAFTLSNPLLLTSPADWSISVSASPDNTQWELNASGATPIAVGGELDFSYQLSFAGSFSCTQTLNPLRAAPVPEPGTLVLAFSGLLGLAALRVSRRRRV